MAAVFYLTVDVSASSHSVSLWLGETLTIEASKHHPEYSGIDMKEHSWAFVNPEDEDKVTLSVSGRFATVSLKKFFTGSVKITSTSIGYSSSRIYTIVDEFYVICNKVDISLAPNSLVMEVNEQAKLQWEFNPATSNPAAMVTFSSENPEIASVDGLGNILALSPGTTIINARTNYETLATCAVQVNPINVMFLSLDKTSVNLSVGETDFLVANLFPDNATNKSIKWTSSDPSVVIVSSNGQILGRSEGTAIITASTADGSELSATCEVTVGKSTAGNLRGDLDGSGIVDVSDVNELINIILNN